MAAWPSRKKHSGALGSEAKVALRERVLSEIPEACVFDAFCGPHGDMFAAVWRKAKCGYVGVDQVWLPTDKRPRYVADAALVLRAIDLSKFNVFDLDSFGSPWTEAIVLAARRMWSAGERGALVVTDGAQGKLKFGRVNALNELLGPASHRTLGEQRQRSAIVAWCRRSGVTPERIWMSEGYSATRGSQKMVYSAVVFHGTGPSATSAAPSPSLDVSSSRSASRRARA